MNQTIKYKANGISARHFIYENMFGFFIYTKD